MRPITSRWLLPGLFILGMLDINSPLLKQDVTIYWLNLISFFVTILLFTQLGRSIQQTLWIWVIWSIFIIGYYFKTYLISWSLDEPLELVTNFTYEWEWISAQTLSQGYYVFTLAYVVFCTMSFIVLHIPLSERAQIHRLTSVSMSPQRSLVLVLVATALSLGLTIIRLSLGIGVMGLENPSLPLRLDTIIFRLQSDVLPLLLLLGIWVLDTSKHRGWWFLSLSLLLLHFLTVSMIAASRAGLIKFALSIFFLWLTTQRLTRERMLAISFPLIGTMLFYPLISSLRLIRIQTGAGFFEAIPLAAQFITTEEWSIVAQNVIRHVITRISGAEGIWFVQKHIDNAGANVTPWSVFQDSLTVYYTQQIVGITGPEDFRSPGIVGAFMFLGELLGMVILWVIFIFLIYSVWNRLSCLYSRPVVLAAFAYFVLSFVGEGTLQIQDWIAFLIAVYVCEWVSRRMLRRVLPAQSLPRSQMRPQYSAEKL